MITTFETAPAPILCPFVRSYAYREFDTNHFDVVKPRHAQPDIAIHFFFKGIPIKIIDPSSGKILKTGKNSGVSGLSSKYIGDMTFNGSYSFFEISFKPHGFHALFNIPSVEVMDDIIWTEEIFDASIPFLHEQLSEAKNALEMSEITNAYLIRCLQKHSYYSNKVSFAINTVVKNKGLINIDQLARDYNMSTRSFERDFIQTVGIPAKLFCCITRFNYALNLKLANPLINWTSIAHQTGYFDQMHLIKDFKKFSGNAPVSLLKETPLLIENFMSKAE